MSQDIAFEYKGGRRLANQKDVAYILPSDEPEVTRLELNHELWKRLIGSIYKSPIHDKLVQGIRVLDVGCGPGWWTLEMAKFYPCSEFVGVDMADIFVTENKPRNVTFKVANAGSGFDFEEESFDFVFQRFLVMGFPTEQYLHSIKEMKRILRRGGYIEILELINNYDNGGPALCDISSWIHQALEARNMDSFIANKIPTYLADAGYKNVCGFDYSVPIGLWGGELGELHLAIQKLALPAVEVMVVELTSVDSDKYKDTLEKAFKEIHELNVSTCYKLIYATKE